MIFRSVLVPIDLGHEESWTRPVPIAATLAGTDAELHLMTVTPDLASEYVSQYFPPEQEETMRDDARRRLDELADTMLPGRSVQRHVATGRVYETILRTADAVDADLIVIAAKRPDMSDFLLGPNAARVVRHAKQSVFVVRD